MKNDSALRLFWREKCNTSALSTPCVSVQKRDLMQSIHEGKPIVIQSAAHPLRKQKKLRRDNIAHDEVASLCSGGSKILCTNKSSLRRYCPDQVEGFGTPSQPNGTPGLFDKKYTRFAAVCQVPRKLKIPCRAR